MHEAMRAYREAGFHGPYMMDHTPNVTGAAGKEGMAFAVFASHGEIVDPDSGESLGSWEMVKARVVATHVQPRMCTVRAPAVGEAPVVGDTRPLSAMMVEHSVSSAKGDGEWERLEVRGADISGRPQAHPIAVGDGARVLAETPPDAGDREDAGYEPEA